MASRCEAALRPIMFKFYVSPGTRRHWLTVASNHTFLFQNLWNEGSVWNSSSDLGSWSDCIPILSGRAKDQMHLVREKNSACGEERTSVISAPPQIVGPWDQDSLCHRATLHSSLVTASSWCCQSIAIKIDPRGSILPIFILLLLMWWVITLLSCAVLIRYKTSISQIKSNLKNLIQRCVRTTIALSRNPLSSKTNKSRIIITNYRTVEKNLGLELVRHATRSAYKAQFT